MSGFVVSPENAANGWRQRGYSDGRRGTAARPPEGRENEREYRVGYRRGTERRLELARP